jgi:choline dehydrogenase-like flavoprotein
VTSANTRFCDLSVEARDPSGQRFLPSDFVLKTHLTNRYGKQFLPEDMTIQDWGITYDELEPFYDALNACGGTVMPSASAQSGFSAVSGLSSRVSERRVRVTSGI